MALLHGMPGIGKTEAVLQYISRSAYRVLVWLNCTTLNALEESVYRFLDQFHLLEPAGTPEDLWEVFSRYLNGGDHVLVVFDNANEPGVLDRIAAMELRCHRLITSCLSWPGEIFNPKAVISWGELDEEEGSSLVSSLTGIPINDGTRDGLRRLVEMCGGIPLALCQAAAYIQSSKPTLDAYLDLCRENLGLLLDQSWELPSPSLRHPGVYATFRLSYEAIRTENINSSFFQRSQRPVKCRCAIKILQLASFLSMGGIEEAFMRSLDPIFTPIDFNDGLGIILSYSLIRRENGVLYFKEILQDALRSFLSSSEWDQTFRQVVQGTVAAFSLVEPISTNLSQFEGLSRQAETLLTHAAKTDLSPLDKGVLLRGIGGHHFLAGNYLRAEGLLLHARDLAPDRSSHLYLRICGDLAELYESWDQNGKARTAIADTLDGWDYLRQADPLGLAQIYLTGAHIFQNLLEFDNALGHVREAVKLLDAPGAGLDEETRLHQLATAYTCKGNIHYKQQDYLTALDDFKMALLTARQSRHPDDQNPLVGDIYGNIANSLLSGGYPADAELIYGKQLEIYRNVYKDLSHPTLAYAYSNIGKAYLDRGNFVEAAEKFIEARAILEEGCCPNHFLLCHIYNNYAMTFLLQGEYATALSLFETALEKNGLVYASRRATEIGATLNLNRAFASYGVGAYEDAHRQLESARTLAGTVLPRIAETVIQILSRHQTLVAQLEHGDRIEDLMRCF